MSEKTSWWRSWEITIDSNLIMFYVTIAGWFRGVVRSHPPSESQGSAL